MHDCSCTEHCETLDEPRVRCATNNIATPTGQTTVRLVTITAPSRPVKGEIMRSKGAQDKKETVADLADFLDKCMSLDPRQRISLEQCSAHSFLRRT